MGHQIIKQPNNKFAVWSTMVDSFILINASEEDILKHFITSATETIEYNVKHIINELNSGIKPYNRFTMTWKEALKKIEEVHGMIGKELIGLD